MKTPEEAAREAAEMIMAPRPLDAYTTTGSVTPIIASAIRARDAEWRAEVERVAKHLADNEQYHEEHAAKGFMVDHHRATASTCGFYLTLLRTELLKGNQ